ncbi:RadC family protein [Sphingomonas sp. ID0503]|uniref:RadC family protein n=1 Tax=Sphingomonas sp. ID0503 TaxID=3399691 RepID=UPI003AFAA784
MGEDHLGEGHRARLRQRLFDGGGDALLDHELLEYLLTLSIRRGDTKAIAKRLIDAFGSFGAVLTADAKALARIGGIGDTSIAAIKIAQASALRLLQKQVLDRPVLSNWQALLDYLQADMGHLDIERVRVLHLNAKNMLMRDEPISEGSTSEAAIYVREVVRRAIDLGSAALIIVHNHPSGDPSPSRQDIAITRELIAAAKPLKIQVHDHIIVSASGHKSLRAEGLL